jgi:hypothetical protein
MGDGSLVLELMWNNLSNAIVSFLNSVSATCFITTTIELTCHLLTTGSKTINA